jgi:cytoskeletal protein CcmA (bactofilin family)
MAIFNKGNEVSKTTNSTTIISKGSKIIGEFNLTAKLHIEGEVDGKIVSTNEVSIGSSGKVSGELKAKKLIVNGEFNGKVEVDIVEITKNGVLRGDIIICDISIEQGGKFEGTSALKREKEEVVAVKKK